MQFYAYVYTLLKQVDITVKVVAGRGKPRPQLGQLGPQLRLGEPQIPYRVCSQSCPQLQSNH